MHRQKKLVRVLTWGWGGVGGNGEDFTGLMSLCDRETEEWERKASSNLSRAAQEELSGLQAVVCG